VRAVVLCMDVCVCVCALLFGRFLRVLDRHLSPLRIHRRLTEHHPPPPTSPHQPAALPVEPSNVPEAKVGTKTDEYGLPVAPLHN
jgi:hypothetical protein